MSNETEGMFTFTWKIDYVSSLLRAKGEYQKESKIYETEQFNGSKWFLKLYRHQSSPPRCFRCCLCRQNDDCKSENISVTYKLEVIDHHGKIFQSVERENIKFSKSSSDEVYNFPDNNIFEFYVVWDTIVTIRCQIIDPSYKKQAKTVETPTVIRTQWVINVPCLENWSKELKVPFHKLTDIDIIMHSSKERINIKIERMDLLHPYKLKIAILNEENRKIDCELQNKAVENQKFETWIEKSQLMDKSHFHLPYSFTLVCSITTSGGNSDSSTQNQTLEDFFTSLKASPLPLQDDLKKLLLNDKHSDVKLRTHNTDIPAHKCLLSARSPVFAKMFDQDMLETQTGVVDIPDVESETLQSFAEFLYTDIITNTDYEQLLKLILVADKYQVDCLKKQCSIILMSKLSLENVCEVVSVSDMVNLPNLKMCAFNFIKENKKKIISSPVWSEWVEKNTRLAIEILTKLIDL